MPKPHRSEFLAGGWAVGGADGKVYAHSHSHQQQGMNAHTSMHTRLQIFDNIWTRSKNANTSIGSITTVSPYLCSLPFSIPNVWNSTLQLNAIHIPPAPSLSLLFLRFKVFPLAHFVVEHGLFKCLSQSILVTKTNGCVTPPPLSIP